MFKNCICKPNLSFRGSISVINVISQRSRRYKDWRILLLLLAHPIQKISIVNQKRKNAFIQLYQTENDILFLQLLILYGALVLRLKIRSIILLSEQIIRLRQQEPKVLTIQYYLFTKIINHCLSCIFIEYIYFFHKILYLFIDVLKLNQDYLSLWLEKVTKTFQMPLFCIRIQVIAFFMFLCNELDLIPCLLLYYKLWLIYAIATNRVSFNFTQHAKQRECVVIEGICESIASQSGFYISSQKQKFEYNYSSNMLEKIKVHIRQQCIQMQKFLCKS
ncbi:unnamed protein product [Paramecium octaurelia]|uniref:Transmembrane protein n=1 Tax=Paramecium octaurelia TaxID=43137 RepID=A0A8S1YKN3_PAROT|nr:unnamed protein product [Paramecium octaurelia]